VNAWAVPGRKCYLNRFDNNFTGAQNANFGSPFTILGTYIDGSNNLCIDTDLAAIPAYITTSSTVTVSNASGSLQINWAAHGLIAGTCVAFNVAAGGTFPGGINPSAPYFVAAPVNAGNFLIKDQFGNVVPFSTSGSGTLTAYANPLGIKMHPCPRLTVKNCTGCDGINHLGGADDEPAFSRLRYRISGPILTGELLALPQIIWGTLISLTVNVIRPYTGGVATMNLTIIANGYVPGTLAAGNLTAANIVINTKVAGIRTLGPTAGTTSGAQAGDTLAFYPNWISDSFTINYSNPFSSDTFATAPIIEIEVLTDQGATKYHLDITQPVIATGGSVHMFDTGINRTQG